MQYAYASQYRQTQMSRVESSTISSVLWSIGLVVKVLDSQSRVPVFETSCVGSKVDSAFRPSEVNQMSTRNLWELSGRK